MAAAIFPEADWVPFLHAFSGDEYLGSVSGASAKSFSVFSRRMPSLQQPSIIRLELIIIQPKHNGAQATHTVECTCTLAYCNRSRKSDAAGFIIGFSVVCGNTAKLQSLLDAYAVQKRRNLTPAGSR